MLCLGSNDEPENEISIGGSFLALGFSTQSRTLNSEATLGP